MPGELFEAFAKLTFDERLDRWALEAHPTRFGKVKRRLGRAVKINPSDVVLSQSTGEIVSMPLDIERPCFGEILPHLRYFDRSYFDPRTRTTQHSHCGRCPMATACKIVVETRIKIVPDLALFVERWFASGQRDRDWRHPFASSWGAKIRNALRAHGPFTSSNDAKALAHINMLREQHRCREAGRKVRGEEKAWLAGHGDIPAAIIDAAFAESDKRAAILFRLLGRRDTPPQIRRLTADGVVQTANIWLATTMLELERRPVNPSSIARWLLDQELSSLSYESLRQRVPSYLARVELLTMRTLSRDTQPAWLFTDWERRLLGRGKRRPGRPRKRPA